MFKRGQQVVRVLRLAGVETAVLTYVESVRKGVVTVRDYETRHDAKTGAELAPSGMGSVRLIALES